MRGVITLIAACGLFLSSHANGEGAEPLSIICKGDQSIGFNWENGRWKNVHFQPNTYLVMKLHSAKAPFGCFDSERTPPIISKSQKVLSDRCYQAQILGEQPIFPAFDCTEFWNVTDSGEYLSAVYCNNQNPSIRLNIDGEFVYTDDMAPFTYPLTGKRYSIIMEIGKCARVPQ